MRHAGCTRALGTGATMLAALSLVTGCADLPADSAWHPPAWAAESSAIVSLKHETMTEPTNPTDAADAADTAEATNVPGTAGLIDGRIRNDRAGLQVRYVELQGAWEFNDRVTSIIGAAITGTGVSSFTPEVFDVNAGLADRGCATGAAQLPATELLADPRFGPVGGDGTAVVCEVTGTFGPVLAVAFRTVTGAAGSVKDDRVTTLLVNVESGEVTDGAELWTPEAATELWEGAVEQLRRDQGALSAAPTAPPDDAQLALAQDALAAPVLAGDTLSFTLPAGLTAAELVALGAPATSAPLTVTVDGKDPAGVAPKGWLTPAGEKLLAHLDTPFVGVPGWNGNHPVDCDLVACIAVTYDDGPSGFTAELLDTLAAHESAATFFMLGNAVAGHADVVARTAREGHELGSHSMTHPDLTKLSSKKARKQVLQAANAITTITGQPVTMYRPPYGALSPTVLSMIDLPAILWTIDTLDWEGPGQAALVSRSVEAADTGDIILFHDTHADTVNAAGKVLDGLKNRGFTPVTITQLFDGAVPTGKVFGR